MRSSTADASAPQEQHEPAARENIRSYDYRDFISTDSGLADFPERVATGELMGSGVDARAAGESCC